MKNKEMKCQLTTLPDGLRILSFSMPARQSVTLGIWAACGGRYEDMDKSGISHFIEHMLFKGTKNYTCLELKKAIEGVGGYLNAFTAEEFTCYYSRVTSAHLRDAFGVLSEMVICPKLAEADFKKEKFVVLEEIKLYLDLPSHYVVDILYKLMWPDQSLGMFLAGTHKTVSDMDCRDLRKFKELHYTAPNICIVACGDILHRELVKQAREAFKGFKKGDKNKFTPATRIKDKLNLKMVEKKLEQTHLALGFHASGRRDEYRYAESLLNIMLGANMSSRLFQKVREEKGLAYEIGSHIRRYDEVGALIINAGIHNDKKEEALEVILKELNKLTRKGPSADELKRAKEFFRGQFMLSLEDTSERMIWMGENLIGLDTIEDERNILKKIEVISSAEIKNAALRIFRDDNLNLSVIGPLKTEEEKQIEGILKI